MYVGYARCVAMKHLLVKSFRTVIVFWKLLAIVHDICIVYTLELNTNTVG